MIFHKESEKDFDMNNEKNLDKSGKENVYIPSDLANLIPGFLENRKNDLEKVKQALEQRDYETIRRIGHIWKGTAASYGFDKMSFIGENLEIAATEQRPHEVETLVSMAQKHLKNVNIVYVGS